MLSTVFIWIVYKGIGLLVASDGYAISIKSSKDLINVAAAEEICLELVYVIVVVGR